uniref:BACK domain-containing protein n=1 Tax=Panagrolaimus davidi TaxID=227884 RepID=A0A914PF53_9BILA
MIDIAEFYSVKTFKNVCVEYLSKIQISIENVFKFFELSDKYFLEESKKSIIDYISTNFEKILKSRLFQSLSKSLMKTVVASNQNTLRMEEFFEAVFKFAEIQAFKKQELNEKLNAQETIKEELSEFLPFFKFDQMSIEFLIKFVVRIYDENGKIMKGVLNCHEMEKVCDVIESQKNKVTCYYFWPTKQPKTNVPSKLIKRHEIEWYLIYDKDGDLNVRRNIYLENNQYLLAEMFAEDGFVLKSKCKIEIYRYA